MHHILIGSFEIAGFFFHVDFDDLPIHVTGFKCNLIRLVEAVFCDLFGFFFAICLDANINLRLDCKLDVVGVLAANEPAEGATTAKKKAQDKLAAKSAPVAVAEEAPVAEAVVEGNCRC